MRSRTSSPGDAALLRSSGRSSCQPLTSRITKPELSGRAQLRTGEFCFVPTSSRGREWRQHSRVGDEDVSASASPDAGEPRPSQAVAGLDPDASFSAIAIARVLGRGRFPAWHSARAGSPAGAMEASARQSSAPRRPDRESGRREVRGFRRNQGWPAVMQNRMTA